MRRAGGRSAGWAAIGVAALMLCAAPAAHAFDLAAELRNFSKIGERFEYDQANRGYQGAMVHHSVLGTLGLAALLAHDPGRNPISACATEALVCAGDLRGEGWGGRYGLSVPVQWVSRYGATLSGHLWAPFARGRYARRRLPGVVIVSGTLGAPEQAYWWAAEVLARHGYVALTFDTQTQGRSDLLGAGRDALTELPPRLIGYNSEEVGDFIPETQDALDFLLSSPSRPYRPRGPEGLRKQRARVAAGRANPYDPLHARLDPGRIGLAGHSTGAYAASLLGTTDRRVDAIVAWDNLDNATPTPLGLPGPPLHPRVPALGMADDYYITPTPFLQTPDPQEKNESFELWRRAGVDVAELSIRGGTHYEFSNLPFFPATLRGIDMAAWYTTAWLDRYVKGDRTADARLLTDRWRHDGAEAGVDPNRDGNLFSFYFRSRLALHRSDGVRVSCDDLRAGCRALVPQAADGYPGAYGYLRDSQTFNP